MSDNGKRKELLDKFKIPSTTDKPDKNSEVLAEKEALNWSKLDELERDKKSLENQRYREDTEHRKTLSIWAAVVVSFWLVSVLLILRNNTNILKLNDSVLITLLGTTTLNVLGLMIIVLNDIFNKGKK